MTAAQPTVQIDNQQVRVTEWRFAPGAETGLHRHEMDYVVVPLHDGRLCIETIDGSAEVELRRGESYHRRAGAEHNVVNANSFEFAFVEIELKAATDQHTAGNVSTDHR